MMDIRKLRSNISNAEYSFDITNPDVREIYNYELQSGRYTDITETPLTSIFYTYDVESVELDEDKVRAAIASKRAEYAALEKRQDELQAEIHALAKLLPHEDLSYIPTPFDKRTN